MGNKISTKVAIESNMDELTDSIRKLCDEIKKLSESLGDDLFANIDQGLSIFNGSFDALDNIGKSETTFKKFGDTVGSAFGKIGDKGGSVLSKLGETIDNISGKLGGMAVASVHKFSMGFKLLGSIIQAHPLMTAAVIIGALIAAIIYLWNTNEDFRDMIIGVLDKIKVVFDGFIDVVVYGFSFVKSLIEGVVSFLQSIVDWLISFFAPIFQSVFDGLASSIGTAIDFIVEIFSGILDNFSGVIDGVKEIFQGIIDFVTGVFSGNWEQAWEGVKGIFTGVIDTFAGYFEGVWNTILSIFSKGGEIFGGVVDGIAGAFKTIVNTLIDGINNVIKVPFNIINGLLNEVRKFDILGNKPFKGLWKKDPLPVPQIPKLAKGGTLSQGMAMVGEAGPELLLQQGNRTTVAPLTRGGGANPVDIIDCDRLANIIVQSFVGVSNGLSVKMDKREFGKLVSEVTG